MKEKVCHAIFLAVDSYNNFQPKESRLEKKMSTVLFSRPGYTKTGALDSLGLVNFLVLTEEKMKLAFGDSFILNVSELMENKENFLVNIGTLVNYLELKLK